MTTRQSRRKKADERPYRKNKRSVWTVCQVIGECEDYHYDADAIKEPISNPKTAGKMTVFGNGDPNSLRQDQGQPYLRGDTKNKRSVWTCEDYYYDADAIKEPSVSVDDKRFGKGRIDYAGKETSKRQGKNGTGQGSFVSVAATRNKRSVWKVATRPFHGAHFAVFPEALIEPMIKAGCPKDGVVLDIFMGSGTTAIVAKRLGRRWLGIELNPEYAELANRRIDETIEIATKEIATLEDFMGEEETVANDNIDWDLIHKAINE